MAVLLQKTQYHKIQEINHEEGLCYYYFNIRIHLNYTLKHKQCPLQNYVVSLFLVSLTI